ncbi:hypothetical protein QNI16_31460 [Cytophagaceae bacterium YF14B1]|uniref:Lipoprotein n=1 Tax=Xanthocytophaga flava TaxID=3048013 RepID=A0AAE3UC35_9BACT|nr:hypothetical protein [Xanthocytophaga flavus]MDJ1485058.1 hypothetical protein [Xanthocytophaga flavus]
MKHKFSIARQVLASLFLFTSFSILFIACSQSKSQDKTTSTDTTAQVAKVDSVATTDSSAEKAVTYPPLDTALYSQKVAFLSRADTTEYWPVKAPYPRAGAILPFSRIVAYYGNLYSKQMGILGEYPEEEMLKRLKEDVKKWEKADPETPVIPALHYIAVTAQGLPQKDNTYRLRMPHHQIDRVLEMAKKVNAIVFLDIQVGFSKVQDEVPKLEKYLSMPNVHLGIDPEFSMKGDKRPGKEIGTFDAADINYVTDYLGKLVKDNNIPPKILVVHRFVKPMITNYKKIKTSPEVQIVMHMDGWGPPAKKRNSYRIAITHEPVQFAGFKIFYGNDTKRVNQPRVMSPEEMLTLYPQPIYIQYQ